MCWMCGKNFQQKNGMELDVLDVWKKTSNNGMELDVLKKLTWRFDFLLLYNV